jgi:hypothetical protein
MGQYPDYGPELAHFLNNFNFCRTNRSSVEQDCPFAQIQLRWFLEDIEQGSKQGYEHEELRVGRLLRIMPFSSISVLIR